MGTDFAIQPLNETVEIVLLFVTLVCLVLIMRRNIFGALGYLLSYGAYFGVEVYNNIMQIINEEPIMTDYLNLLVSFVGILLAILTYFDISLNQNRKGSTKDVKTDWFYKNEQYERKFDERADRNQYKF